MEIKREGAVRSAFQGLLDHCARQFDWKLVPEYAIQSRGQPDAKADSALLDKFGLGESNDSADNLEKEFKRREKEPRL